MPSGRFAHGRDAKPELAQRSPWNTSSTDWYFPGDLDYPGAGKADRTAAGARRSGIGSDRTILPGAAPASITTTVAVKQTWPTLAPATGSSATPTDTNYKSQWALTSATAGIDVVNAWQNYTGLGVTIGVIDDGVDYTNPDL